MALRLRPETPLPDGIRDTLLQLIERARADLRHSDDRAEGVHEARKAFKKARAITRLVRTSLEPGWRAEDRFWRDLGRALSAERDAKAVLEAFDGLLGEEAGSPAFAPLRELLVRRQGELVPFPSSPGMDLDGALAAAAERVRGWTLPQEFGPVADGIAEGYRRARRRARRARREPSATNLHAWRRAVKQHAPQVRLLRDAAPGPLCAHLELVDGLAEVLGHDHDLTVLRGLLTREEAAWSDPGLLDGLLDRMARRHAALHRDAFSLGERAFIERPEAFRRRMRGYWRAFVRDQVGDRIQRTHQPGENSSPNSGPPSLRWNGQAQ